MLEWSGGGWFMVEVMGMGYKEISGSDTTPHDDVGEGE